MNPNLAEVLRERPVVLDGGFATQLERRGHDLSDTLWSARLLLEDPDEIVAAHADFFAAGAEVAITASYQVSASGFQAQGLDHADYVRALQDSVTLARRAADSFEDGRPRWVAASVGPYGAALADGSEYRGDYGLDVAGLRAWHRPRLELLAAAGADLLAIETIPSLAEVEAVLAEVAALEIPAWLSLTADGARTRRGESLREAFSMAAEVPGIVAVGANCCDPDDLDAVRAAADGIGLPVLFYPNSGEVWDAARRVWTGAPTVGDLGAGWVQQGVRLVGGCCRVTPDQIGAIAASLE